MDPFNLALGLEVLFLVTAMIYIGLSAVAVVPLVLGVLVRRSWPRLSEKLMRPVNLVSTLSFVAAMIVGNALKKEAAGVIDGSVLTALIFFLSGTMVIGWLMGGKEYADRQLLATVTSIRNAGLGREHRRQKAGAEADDT
jgi:predicted Na+-dependent transporter